MTFFASLLVSLLIDFGKIPLPPLLLILKLGLQIFLEGRSQDVIRVLRENLVLLLQSQFEGLLENRDGFSVASTTALPSCWLLSVHRNQIGQRILEGRVASCSCSWLAKAFRSSSAGPSPLPIGQLNLATTGSIRLATSPISGLLLLRCKHDIVQELRTSNLDGQGSLVATTFSCS